MSGIKKAEVTRSLNGTMRSVEKGLADCMEMATALSSVGRKDFNHRCSESKRIHETGWLIDGPNIPGRPFWVMRHRTPLLT